MNEVEFYEDVSFMYPVCQYHLYDNYCHKDERFCEFAHSFESNETYFIDNSIRVSLCRDYVTIACHKRSDECTNFHAPRHIIQNWKNGRIPRTSNINMPKTEIQAKDLRRNSRLKKKFQKLKKQQKIGPIELHHDKRYCGLFDNQQHPHQQFDDVDPHQDVINNLDDGLVRKVSHQLQELLLQEGPYKGYKWEPNYLKDAVDDPIISDVLQDTGNCFSDHTSYAYKLPMQACLNYLHGYCKFGRSCLFPHPPLNAKFVYGTSVSVCLEHVLDVCNRAICFEYHPRQNIFGYLRKKLNEFGITAPWQAQFEN